LRARRPAKKRLFFAGNPQASISGPAAVASVRSFLNRVWNLPGSSWLKGRDRAEKSCRNRPDGSPAGGSFDARFLCGDFAAPVSPNPVPASVHMVNNSLTMFRELDRSAFAALPVHDRIGPRWTGVRQQANCLMPWLKNWHKGG
jgi:hypothetical protein